MISHIEIEKALELPCPIFIDVRSESEFREDHLPQALNIPIFDDSERAQVGTVYKNEGPDAARKLGLKIITPKLPEIVEQISSMDKNRQIVIYCWRGGSRSLALATILDLMNIHVYRLQGGYKKFRKYINEYFQQEHYPFNFVMIHGLTGTGKTKVISYLNRLGSGTIDLEGLANNRGSVFGNIGLPAQPTQKKFESSLWERLSSQSDKPFIILECESKRVGKIIIPDSLFSAMSQGRHILIYDSIENRTKRIMSDYQVDVYNDELIDALKRLKNKLGNEKIADLSDKMNAGKYEAVIADLLVNYYDPLYKYPDQASPLYDFCISSAQEEEAAKGIIEYLSLNNK